MKSAEGIARIDSANRASTTSIRQAENSIDGIGRPQIPPETGRPMAGLPVLLPQASRSADDTKPPCPLPPFVASRGAAA